MPKPTSTRATRGLSLVELLAVMLVLSVLAAAATPLYVAQRKSACGRVCRENLTIMSKSMAAYAFRNNQYPANLAAAKTALVGAPEGLAAWPKCPLGQDYTYTGGGTSATIIACPNTLNTASTTHNGYGGTGGSTATTGDWAKNLAAPGADSLP